MATDDGVDRDRILLGEWARLLLGSLARAGVEDVVISPGSRSTPFVVAAQQCPGLRCHSVLDERVAAFFALGRTRMTGRPCLLLCTSGTAAAHYFPALLEAEAAGLPLLVLSADRPLELADCGAPQTVDQIKLFGDHVRGFFELGLPDPTPHALQALRRTAVQAVLRARWPQAGPVHLNARARKPLEPSSLPVSERGSFERELGETVDRILGADVVAFPALTRADEVTLDELAQRCRSAERGLIVAGALAPHRAAQLAAPFERFSSVSGFGAAPDAASGLRFGGGEGWVIHLASLLRSRTLVGEQGPDLVIQIGEPPLASGWPDLFTGDVPPELVVLSEHRWSDPTSRATRVVFGDLETSLDGLAVRLEGEGASEGARVSPDWLTCRDEALDQAVDEVLRRAPQASGAAWSEALVARSAVEGLPPGALLALGNSLAIRLVEQYGGRRRAPLRIATQRGINGIDGLIAGFAGCISALESSGQPAPAALLLLGDVSLAHDLGGLRALASVDATPTVVLVLDNGGGRIFEQLPLGGLIEGEDAPAEEPLALWTTPPGIDLAEAARALGLDYQEVSSRSELEAALAETTAERRRAAPATLLVAPVAAHDAALGNERLGEAVSTLLARRTGTS